MSNIYDHMPALAVLLADDSDSEETNEVIMEKLYEALHHLTIKKIIKNIQEKLHQDPWYVRHLIAKDLPGDEPLPSLSKIELYSSILHNEDDGMLFLEILIPFDKINIWFDGYDCKLEWNHQYDLVRFSSLISAELSLFRVINILMTVGSGQLSFKERYNRLNEEYKLYKTTLKQEKIAHEKLFKNIIEKMRNIKSNICSQMLQKIKQESVTIQEKYGLDTNKMHLKFDEEKCLVILNTGKREHLLDPGCEEDWQEFAISLEREREILVQLHEIRSTNSYSPEIWNRLSNI